MGELLVHYRPDGEVLSDFLYCQHKVVVIVGPVGSGKSSGIICRKLHAALNQPPDDQGVRRRRTGVIRNTLPMLRTSAMKTFHQPEWFPTDVYGEPRAGPPPFSMIKIDLPDGTRVEWEILWIGLDQPSDVVKLLSTDLSDAWINEGLAVQKPIVDALTDRIGRFPGHSREGCYLPQLHIDSNAPAATHWLPIMAGWTQAPDSMTPTEKALLIKPPTWEFFLQPPAMLERRHSDNRVTYHLNPKRENQRHLRADYYDPVGKTRNYVEIYYCCKFRKLRGGKPVFEWYNRDFHVSPVPLEADPNLPLYMGIDPSLNTGVVFGQKVDGQWRILRELFRQDMGATRFVPELIAFMAREFPRWPTNRVPAMMDPHGDDRSEEDDGRTTLKIYRAAQLNVRLAPTNDPPIRLGMVDQAGESFPNGAPGLVVDQSCVMLIEGFEGEYKYAERGGPHAAEMGGHQDLPLKNLHSNVHDALQYLMCNTGDHQVVMSMGRQKPETKRGSVQVPRTYRAAYQERRRA